MKSCGLLFYTAVIWRSLEGSAEAATPAVKKMSPAKVVRAEEGQNITVECPLEYLASQPRVRPTMHLQTEQGRQIIIEDNVYGVYERFSLKYGGKFLTVGLANVSKADAGRYICGVQPPFGNPSSLMFEIVVTESNRQEKLLLPLVVPALLLLLLTAGGLLALMCYKKRNSNRERGGDNPEVATKSLRIAGFPSDPERADIWVVMYENLPAPAQRPADPIYQNLPLDARDNNPIYSTIDSRPQLYDTVC